ncbi:DUF6541 family protein [Microbacterium rhizosphaerae]|uniref:DUF6541 family protein n=1 Tax=Microbacterium rhizosphaerae TaxID=1678237 RepID=A0ABZ0SSM3_9MICO|nr:DUF6541 family protein [Microbacterium rhizosphaerae]WPR90813.1 DUF6541 family protein [Microbacterium rhizosphaerae]
MPWLTLLAASAAVVFATIVPGLAAGLVLRLRGLTLWALAAPFGLSIIAVASVILPFVHVEWSLWAVLVFAVVSIALVAVVRVLLRRFNGPRRQRIERASGWWTVGGLAAAAVAITIQVILSIGAPGAVSQTFDNVFHLDAIRYILQTHDASPLWIGTMTSPRGGLPFYPDAWHALGALVVSVTGVSIPVAANAITVVFAALVWPAGAVLLARTLFGSRRAVTIGAAVAACALPAFPLLMITYGVLFPFFLGLAVLPAAVVAAVQLLRLGQDCATYPRWVWIVVVVGCLPGLTLAHPGAFMAWLAMVAVAAVVAAAFYFASRPPRRAMIRTWVALAVFAALAGIALWVLRPPDAARTWPIVMTVGQAFGEALTASMYWAPVSITAVFLIVGFVYSIRLRTRSAVFAASAFAIAGALYIICASLPYWRLRDLFVGAWYDNTPRLAAILPMTIVPLAAFGMAKAWDFVVRLLSRRDESPSRTSVPRPAVRGIAAVAGLLVIIGWTQWSMRDAVNGANFTYAATSTAPLLTAEELALIQRVDKNVPANAIIAGSPWTGTSLVYALADRRVLMPHIFTDTTKDTDLINTHLRDATPGSAVCKAVEREHVRYVLDFGTQEVHGAHHDFGGVSDLQGSPAVRLIDSQGKNARLYQIIGCGEAR